MALFDDAISVLSPGATIAVGAVSASVAIPVCASGVLPRFIRLAATAPCYARIGNGAGTTAAAGDLMVQPADNVILKVPQTGITHVAAIQVAGAGVLQISPLEDL